jgi:hypothetical protein
LHIELTEQEKEKGYKYKGSVAISARKGLFIKKEEQDTDLKEKAELFFKELQRSQMKSSPFNLIQLSLEGELKENSTIFFNPIFKVDDNVEVEGCDNLITHQIVKKYDGDSIQLILGKVSLDFSSCIISVHINKSLKNSTVEMDKKKEGLFSANLLIPVGKYEIKVVYDGEEKMETISVCKSSEEVADSEILEQTEKKRIYVRSCWFKSQNGIEYTEIKPQRSLEYIPVLEDIGSSLKVEFGAYYDANFKDELFKVYHFSEDKIQQAEPTCVSLEIDGDAIEGKILKAKAIYLGGKKGPCQYKWFGPHGKVVEGQQYELTIEDIGYEIGLEFTPIRKDGLFGEVKKVKSNIVQPATPEIENLTIVGELIQDQVIAIDYEYYGGTEGESKIQWYVSAGEDFENQKVIEGANGKELLLTADHVGRKITVKITPFNAEGVEGHVVSKTSDIIAASAPMLKSLEIIGQETLVQDQIIMVRSEYHGGFEGSSRIEWYRVNELEERTRIQDAFGDKYTLTLDDIGYYIEAVKTPIRTDGIMGKAKSARTNGLVQATSPQILTISFIGEFIEDETITVYTEYYGGIEGQSKIEWFRVGEEDSEKVEKATGHRELQLSFDDLDKKIRVTYIPVRNDGVEGEQVEITSDLVKAAKPTLLNISLNLMDAIEEEAACGVAEFHGGIEIERRHKWIRIDENEQQFPIEEANSDVYVLSKDDVGCKVVYGVQQIRADLTTEWFLTEPCDKIRPKAPEISEFIIDGELRQDAVLEARVKGKYFALEKSKFRWVRVDSQDVETLVGEEQVYNTTKEDVTYRLKCYFTPIRPEFDIIGEELSCITDETVLGYPTINNCSITGELIEAKELIAYFEYCGGREGKSIVNWYRVTDTEQIQIASNITNYILTLEDVGHYIKIECIPVRDDGIQGEPAFFKTTNQIAPGFPSTKSIRIEGEALEDCKFVARTEYFGGKEGASMKRWRRMNDQTNQVVAIETDEYTITKQDIGYQLCFEYTPIREDGVKGKMTKVETEKIRANAPSVANVKISGSGSTFSTLEVLGAYYGGFEGESEYLWLESQNSEGPFTPIPGASKKIYNIPFEKIGSFIKAKYTPVRQDGMKGDSVETNSSIKVVLDKETTNLITASIAKGSVDIAGFTGEDNIPIRIEISHQTITLRNSENKKKISSFDLNDTRHCLTYTEEQEDASNGRALIFTYKDNTWKLNADNAMGRDKTIILYRVFLALSKENLCRNVFGQSVQIAWKKRRSNLENEVKQLDTVPIPSEIPASSDSPELIKAAKIAIEYRKALLSIQQ